VTRLLVISPGPLRGGAEEYALKVAVEGVQRGWQVSMALPVAEGVTTLRRDAKQSGVHVVDLNASDNYEFGVRAPRRLQIIETWRTVRLLRAIRPDVVNLTVPFPRYALSCIAATAIVNTPTLVVFQLVKDPVLLAASPWIYRVLRRRKQAWIAVSHNGQRLLARAFKVPARLVDVIQNGGTSLLVGMGRQEARGSVRREFGLDTTARIVMNVGRLTPQKGQLELVDAVAPILRASPDVYVVIVGEGELAGRLREEALAKGVAKQVILTGSREDVPRLLAAADIFAFPSQFEGTPFALLEAMSAGLPAVVAHFPGAEEIVRDGQDGLVVPLEDTPRFRTALERVLSDDSMATHLAAGAEERSRFFSTEKMLSRTFATMADLV
jgi:glycosyltransferase involved in cell wall biosynthesis